MKLDLDTILRNAKGDPFFVTGIDGNAVYNLLLQWQVEGVALADCIKRIESLAGGKGNIRPLDLGDLLYRANESSEKMGKGTRTEKRVRGQLEEKLVRRGAVEFTAEEKLAIEEDCEARYSGAVLVRLDRIFAQAVLDAAPKPELVKEEAG